MRRLLQLLPRAVVFIVLTLVTQVGGIAYLMGLAIASMVSRRFAFYSQSVIALLIAAPIYLAMTYFLVPPLAAAMGRVRLPCETRSQSPLVAASKLTCVLNRSYVRPEVHSLLMSLGAEAGQRFPGTQVTALEGNFPFADGFPLLPHLSHRDGKKLDLAFFYRTADKAIAHGSPSRLGYFVYEQPRTGDQTPCAGRWTPLRWDFDFFQPRPPAWHLDEERTAWMLRWLKEHPQISRIFVEPHLADRMGVAGGKVRFQGCHAARHDDHIHVEVP
jgi:hypothetical protein